MARKWLIGLLAAVALALGTLAYHLFVLEWSERHYRLLLEAQTVEEKRQHFEEIHRFYHPWNPAREKADKWLKVDGHEWEFLGYPPGGPCR